MTELNETPLWHLLSECKIPVMGEFKTKSCIASGEDYRKGWITDYKEVYNLWHGKSSGNLFKLKIRRFRFRPKPAGLLVIDIDRHYGCIDGLEAFYKCLSENNINEPMLKSIESGSFPCYVTTPNNGFHLYFRYSGNENFSKKLTDSVEVFYSDRCFLTAPGSYANKIRYKLYGNLLEAPLLFPSLHKLLVSKMPVFYRPPSNVRRKYSLQKIAGFVEFDNKWRGRNDKSFMIACRARKEGYDKDETLAFLFCYSGLDGLPNSEIISTVESAYKELINGTRTR
jgi:hypothetical protein